SSRSRACRSLAVRSTIRGVRLWCALAMVVVPALAHAQEGSDEDKPAAAEPAPPAPTTGTIEGTVEAPDLDAPLAGATVTVVGTAITSTTDDAGHYTLAGVAPGTVKVRVDFVGFRSQERAVVVAVGPAIKADFQLTTLPLLNETIVVVGSRTPRTNAETP